MSDKINTVTCTACGLEYSKGEKRCPLCGVRNKNIDIISLLTKKKTDDTYADVSYGGGNNTEKKRKTPAKTVRTTAPVTRPDKTPNKRKKDTSALSLIIKFILIVLAMLIFG